LLIQAHARITVEAIRGDDDRRMFLAE